VGFVYNAATATATAQLTLAALGVGAHTITATYSGDPNITGSSGLVAQTVGPASTTTTVVAAPSVLFAGQAVTLTATVAVNDPSSGAPVGPGGLVAFLDNGITLLGIAATSGGHAGLTTTTLPVGVHNVTAMFSGDGDFTGSASAAAQVVVLPHPTTTTVTSSTGGTAVVGQPVTFTAVTTFAPGTTAPGGAMVFVVDGTTLAPMAFSYDPSTGTATAQLTMSSLAVGGHTISAAYTGDPGDTGSSAAVAQTTTQASTATLFGQTVRGPAPEVAAAAVTVAPPAGFAVSSPSALFAAVLPALVADVRLAVGGGDTGGALVAGGGGSSGAAVVTPAALLAGQRELVRGASYFTDVGNRPSNNQLSEQIAGARQAASVPDSPVVGLNVAPVEVNVLKVISSLNDGGTNVLHFEQMLHEGTTAAAGVQGDKPAPTPAVSTGAVEPESADEGATAADLPPPRRSWPWWLAGGTAAVALATLARYLLPRWRYQAQPE
jgi:hypothetical protein